MRGIVGDAVWDRLPSRTRADRRAEGPALVAELAALRAGAPYDPAAVKVPVVTGYGTRSKPYHQEAARRLADEVADGECLVIDDSGHGAHSSHADELRRLGPPGRGPDAATTGLASEPCPTSPPST